ncbi:uncharacterized protein B0T23DRAFT_52218 [Neurospora hispaniola]|uniref:Uncharacterized protein n=1 Tax=Neurospora hispaniola TaxID=588809 RepID=A0AAJ0HY81_9PEZI|nr:hypothetical protein B0T23DRAFT_52218 [Neurospora hispaniola]
MMLWQPTTLLAALLAMAPAVQAGIGALIVEGMTRDSPAYHRRMEEIMGSYLLRRGFLEERQAELSASSVGQDPIFTADGTLNMTAWNAQVNAACISTLRQLKQASNPSGTCVCYNLPALDNSTGVFEADLRLFRISDARDSFAGIAPEKISVGLRFTGANVRTANPDQPVAGASQASQGAAAAAAASTSSQAETASPSSGAVGAASVGRVGGSGDGEAANKLAVRQTIVQDLPSNGDPTLLQQYLLVGKIDADKMTGQMTMAQLQHLLLPIVTLSGVNPQGAAVSTNISSNEAAFVAGVFSKEVVLSDFNRAQLAVEDEIARLKNGTTAFVLPGVQIMIFPVGLVITSVWLAIGIAAYGYGTFVRYNFAVQYKQRRAVVERGGMARI